MTATLSSGILDIPFADYFALKAWGSSSLKAMRRGPPARVLWERDNRRDDTDATILGTAVHSALLTIDLFEKTYCSKPEGMTFASKEGKAWRDDPERAGKTILSHDMGKDVIAILKALEAKRAVWESLEQAMHIESSLVWNCPITGEPCKARPDWIDAKYIYDLKVTRHAGNERVGLRAFAEGWMHQLAHYRTGAIVLGLPLIGGRLVVVEPTPPHFVYCLEVKVDALDLLELENMDTLRALGECRQAGAFPGTPDQWARIEPPVRDAVTFDDEEDTEEVAVEGEHA